MKKKIREYLCKTLFLVTLFLIPQLAVAQSYETDISLNPEVKNLVEIETNLNKRLEKLVRNLQNLANMTEKGDYLQARRLLLEMKKNIDHAERAVANQKSLTSLKKFLKSLENDLRTTNRALMKSNKKKALDALTDAYRRAQALKDADSPVFKLTSAEIALNQASQLISGKDYQNAALYLEQAINYITEIQTSGPINTQQLNQLKSDIIVTHQQVVLGKLEDEKALGRFVPGLEAARYNTIHSYYDIWSRSDEPWRRY